MGTVTRVWINGRFIAARDAKISVFDRGFMYGDGVFETMRSYAGVIFRIDDHLARLLGSRIVMKISEPYGTQRLGKACAALLRANGLKSAYIRLAITRGEGRFGMTRREPSRPNVVIVAGAFEPYPDRMYIRGISVEVSDMRQNEYSPISKMKSLNFLPYILARLSAQDDGFDEAILLNTKGRVAEAAASNVFLVKRETLMTPSLSSGIVAGVTRGVIIDIAKRLRIRVREKAVSPEELSSADEVFLTNSLAEVMPVTRLNGRMVGDGHPGDITKLLHISYQKRVIQEVIAA